MKRFFCFLKYHMDLFYWLISKLIHWSLALGSMKYMSRSVWGLSWLLNLVQWLGCFCFLMNCFALAVNNEHFPACVEQAWGCWGDKQMSLASCHHEDSHLASQHEPSCPCSAPGGHSQAWLLFLNFAIFLFPLSRSVSLPCACLPLPFQAALCLPGWFFTAVVW